ncbi:hypothetical protein OUZ56_000418 [Daphnia magna]|uniref:Uncharacterized protein n=1 Tax=Daphnia magna TaxID=35525 RepID=A0ABQ9ZZL3_9CRUS|nr:hypothetical protein OUZ56_000418 [Daphnia magna]
MVTSFFIPRHCEIFSDLFLRQPLILLTRVLSYQFSPVFFSYQPVHYFAGGGGNQFLDAQPIILPRNPLPPHSCVIVWLGSYPPLSTEVENANILNSLLLGIDKENIDRPQLTFHSASGVVGVIVILL